VLHVINGSMMASDRRDDNNRESDVRGYHAETSSHRPNENKISDGWRDGASLRVESGIS
jgi:hypothetical protein